jgi:hypothetical protein
MRRSYKYLYHAAPIPLVRATAQYDPVRTYEARRGVPSRLKKAAGKDCVEQELRERWIVPDGGFTFGDRHAACAGGRRNHHARNSVAATLRAEAANGRRTPVTIDGTRYTSRRVVAVDIRRELREPCSPGLPDISTCERYARGHT